MHDACAPVSLPDKNACSTQYVPSINTVQRHALWRTSRLVSARSRSSRPRLRLHRRAMSTASSAASPSQRCAQCMSQLNTPGEQGAQQREYFYASMEELHMEDGVHSQADRAVYRTI